MIGKADRALRQGLDVAINYVIEKELPRVRKLNALPGNFLMEFFQKISRYKKLASCCPICYSIYIRGTTAHKVVDLPSVLNKPTCTGQVTR